MSQPAHVTSIEALKEFHVALCSFCEEVKEVLCGVNMENSRLLDWVQHRQISFWEREIRHRQEDVSRTKNELSCRKLARMSGSKVDCTEQEEAFRLALARLEEAHEKMDNCKHWARKLPQAIQEYAGQSQQLAGRVEGNPPAIVAVMNRMIDALDQYVRVNP